MKVLRCIRVWFWILTIVLLFISLIFFIAALSPGNDAILGRTIGILIGLLCLGGGIGLFLWAYKQTKKAIDNNDNNHFISRKMQEQLNKERQKKAIEQLGVEREKPQYTYQGSLPLTNLYLVN